jgi:Fe2+ or Zn2+ uptake regulation protein
MRLTKHRQEILDTLTHYHGALSAREIHARLPHINLVTIYRNLEAFVEADMIKKLLLDSSEARYEFQKHRHHHAICDDCHEVQHIHINETKLKDALGLTNFSINDIDIIVRGKCQNEHHKLHHPQFLHQQ